MMKGAPKLLTIISGPYCFDHSPSFIHGRPGSSSRADPTIGHPFGPVASCGDELDEAEA